MAHSHARIGFSQRRTRTGPQGGPVGRSRLSGSNRTARAWWSARARAPSVHMRPSAARCSSDLAGQQPGSGPRRRTWPVAKCHASCEMRRRAAPA